MKKLYIIVFIAFYLITFILQSNAQSWQPVWGESCFQPNKSTWTYVMDVDFHENIYTATQFCDTIIVGDTLFVSDGKYGWPNWLVSQINNEGEIIKSFSITTPYNPYGGSIFETVLTTDKDLNIYLACEYQNQADFLDTIVYIGDHGGNWGAPDILLAKLNKSYEIQWVKVVSAPNQDVIRGLDINSNGDIFFIVEHFTNGNDGGTVNYFDQDSTSFEKTMASILKIDPDGNLLWRKGLTSINIGFHIRNVDFGNHDEIYISGNTRENLIFNGDTIYHPHPGQYEYQSFIVKYDPNSNEANGEVFDWNDLVLSDSDIDNNGNFYFTGYIWDTVAFYGDTLIQHEDSIINIIAKLDGEFTPVWYETTSSKYSQGSYYFEIDIFNDELYFAGRCNREFTLFNTVFSPGYYYQAIIGQVDNDGNLLNSAMIESKWGLRCYEMMMDNCGNMLFSGGYRGVTELGTDTLISTHIDDTDGIVVKVQIIELPLFSLGNDTIVCDEIQLKGPEGYEYYYWNDSLVDGTNYNVDTTNNYHFACADINGCWLYDTIFVSVQPKFDIDLGEDITLHLLDTALISLADTFDTFIWSPGNITNEIIIAANKLGAGTHNIWVDVDHGVCNSSDTIVLNVKQLGSPSYILYPNPTRNAIKLFSEKPIHQLEIFEMSGKLIKDYKVENNENEPIVIDVSNIESGNYIMNFKIDDQVINTIFQKY